MASRRRKPKKTTSGVPSWREFEKLVTRVEQCLAPAGAVIKSPDRLPSNVTGKSGKTQKREVDASIRLQAGSAPLLITIETRKRRPVQDVTWIEQLVTKKQSIGAATTIAVSSTGFSEHARDTALRYGIHLRTLSDITPDDIRGWLPPRSLIHFYRHVDDTEMHIFAYAEEGDTPATTLAPEVVSTLANKSATAPIFTENIGNPVSFHDIWVKVQNEHDFFQRLIPGGPAERRNIRVQFTKGRMSIMTTSGKRHIREVVISASFSIKREDVPLSAAKIIEYASLEAADPAHQRIEFTTTAASLTNFRVGLQRNPGSGDFIVSLEPIPKSPD